MSYKETQKDRDFNKITSLMGDYMESQKTIKTMKLDMIDLRTQIKEMLGWSDRIGSDEIYELQQFVLRINKSLIKIK
jgi:hypothetical protein